MNKPTEAQTKEVWIWCNIKPEIIRTPVVGVVMPSGKHIKGGWEDEFIYPELTLDSLFKYAVPKLDRFSLHHRVGVELDLFPLPEYTEPYDKVPPYDKRITPKHFHYYEAEILIGNDWYGGKDKDPALALFWAIYSIVKSPPDVV